ncbi:MAG: hypothetical protein AAF557_08225 [Pseudomonadota bacterium]
MITILRGLLLVSLIAVAGCRMGAIYNANNVTFAQPATSTQSLSLSQYKNAIIRAGTRRNWQFEELSPGHLLGKVNVRNKHFATVDVTFDTEAFSINYKSSQNLNYNADTKSIHPNYNKWIQNLQNDIQQEVTRAKAS